MFEAGQWREVYVFTEQDLRHHQGDEDAMSGVQVPTLRLTRDVQTRYVRSSTFCAASVW